MRHMTKAEALEFIRKEIKRAGSQVAFAGRVGFAAQYVNDIIHGRKEPSESFLGAVGLMRNVTYSKKEKANG